MVFDFAEFVVDIEVAVGEYLKEGFLIKVDFFKLRVSLVVDIGVGKPRVMEGGTPWR